MGAGAIGDPALVGREAECRLIDGLLEAARAGRSRTLLLRGEPGIGKTALLQYGVARAEGMLVLQARGIESESEISFSGLSELLRPLLGHMDHLPERQAAALASALAIGPPIGGDRFAVAAATLSLLAVAASEGPCLVVVDDLQWLDTSSAEALLFAARRLDAEPAALLFAARPDPAGHRTSGVPERDVRGLDRAASLELLSGRIRGGLSPEVGERLYAETLGNPLALVEIPQLMSEAQLDGRAALDAPLPVSTRIELAFATRVAELPATCRSALLVAAASDTRAVDVISGALRDLGLGIEALEPAEAAGLVTIEGLELEFRHPLIRSSVYYGALPADLRSAHAALAHAFDRRGDELAERRAWHLAAACLEPDEAVASSLDGAAVSARRRSGYAAAARAFERSARLSPAPDRRAARLFASAESWQLANRAERAIELLDEAATLGPDPELRADIHHLRARIDTWRGPANDAFRLLWAESERIAATDPAKSAAMLADAALAGITGGNLGLALDAAKRAHQAAAPLGGRIEVVAALQLGKARILTGDPVGGYPLIMRCTELLESDDLLGNADPLAQCAPALMSVEEYALTDRLLSAIIAAGRAANALGLLPYCLGAMAELEARIGRWERSYADAFESIHLAREAGQEGQLSYNLARLAWLEAAQGREDACRAHVSEALELAGRYSFGSTLPFAQAALGLLELGLGHLEAAIDRLEQTSRLWASMGFDHPGRLQWEAELIEACIRSGLRDRAEEMLLRFERKACGIPPGTTDDAAGRPSAFAMAAACRCRGLLAFDEDCDRAFEEALAWHDRTQTPFERARTELCFGEQLRRQGRRIDARVHLRSALEAFESLGAGPWSQRARIELAATGETVRAGRAEPAQQLTSQELQVALIVAAGATNKEAGAALFLTPKTIEFHLAKIYRKLDLRSRTELARRFAQQAVPIPA